MDERRKDEWLTGVGWTDGAKRALNRLAADGKPITPAVVLDEAANFTRLEDTMPGRTGVWARASADAMELYDYITGKATAEVAG